ncbi:MAG: helix-turn-helix domain-containing protein [Siphonobacter aquaeclarae]|nr:helix-turn-helix domain-containing protein [Siphonobacter aquaeclarae]
MQPTDHLPTLAISAFQSEAQPDCLFSFHELSGSRHFDKPHKHDFFLFLLVENGSGTHTIDFTDHTTAPGQLHLLFPGQVHTWAFGEDLVAWQLMIRREAFETLDLPVIPYRRHPVFGLSPETFALLRAELMAVREELLRQPVSSEIVLLRCRLIARLIGREAEQRFEELSVYRMTPALLRYQSLVDSRFREEKTVAFYAEQLGLTANYLNILCRKYLGVTALSVIRSRIVLEARRLLQTTDLSVKEITFALGFEDAANFSHFFKSQTGLTPREFREQ